MQKNFVVYKSSAGSGKTFTLVREFLRLSLHDEANLERNFRRILAITFTNKAAAEMKTRVTAALAALSGDKQPQPLASQLCEAIDISADTLRERAAKLLSVILHNYSDLSIGTIDSFTHRIVRTFAHDLALPMNFNVELDVKGFYEKVIASLFAKVGEDPYVSKLLREYALTKAEENAGWDPHKPISEFADLLQKENSAPFVAALREMSADSLEAARARLVGLVRDYRSRLRELGGEALSLIQAAGVTDDEFIYGKSGPQGFFVKCANAEIKQQDAEGARIVAAAYDGKWTKGQPSEALGKIMPRLSALASELISIISKEHARYELCLLLSRQMYALMLLRKIEEITAAQKEEDRLVFLSEFNHKIFDIIRHEPAPFIYERLGERYQHYLLDEFQDTSTLQWMNIVPLLDNSLASGWFNLVVGDGKQSIYRWRNANVEQFAKLPEISEDAAGSFAGERSASLRRNFSGEVLATNFRSARDVVDFNNAFFAQLAGSLLDDSHRVIYHDHHQQAGPQGAGWITIDRGKREPDALDEDTFRSVREYVAAAISDGFKPGDICVLARTNSQGSSIAANLVSAGIPVVSSDSLLLCHNREVNVVVSYLRYLLNPSDHINGAVVLHYLYHGGAFSEARFHEQVRRLSQGASLFDILNREGVALAHDPLKNIFEHCIDVIVALRLDDAAFHYLRFFLDEVNDFITQGNGSLAGFLEWWENRSAKASLIVPDSADAVRVMTIHSSKGLEFKAVIVPFCNWRIFSQADHWVRVADSTLGLPVGVVKLTSQAADSGFGEEFERERRAQVLDNLNVLYVAFTRAIERLHIVSFVSSGQRQEHVAGWIDRFIDVTGPSANPHIEYGTRNRKWSADREMPPVFALQPLRFTDSPVELRLRSSWYQDHPEVGNAIRQGLLVHQLLSDLADESGVEKVIREAVCAGKLRQDEAGPVGEKIARIVAHPLLSRFFRDGDIRREAELVTSDGRVLRPDRVVIAGDEVAVIDYKTGQRRSAYQKQLGEYADAIHSMGYRKVRRLLVYVDEGDVEEV